MAGDGRRTRDTDGRSDERPPGAVGTDLRTSDPATDRCRLRAHLITVDGREECTLAPADPDAGERLCAWLTAVEGSFVGLDEVR